MSDTDGYKELATLLGYPDSARFRRLLEYIMTEEQARLVVSLPGSPEELAQKLNLDVETINKLSRDLYKKGVIVPKNFETLEGMRFIPIIIYFHDRMLAVKDIESILPGISAMWNDFLEAEWFADYDFWRSSKGRY